MKKSPKRDKQYRSWKKKFVSTLAMLLIAAVLLTATSYAWIILSVAPEVSGITTNIGANGSLEIALLNAETRADMDAIRTTVGNTLSGGNYTANNTWGNLVDLSYPVYGLGEILLMPARLNVVPTGSGYSVDTGILSVPTYGYDGRITDLTDNTISATYVDNAFSYSVSLQDYGVRAIGTADSLSVQGSSLAMAKSNITTYTNNAKNSTLSVMQNNGDTLFGIVLAHSMDANGTFGDTELAALKAMLNDLQVTLDYIDLALRQGIVAFAASEISNPDTFTAVKDRILDTSGELADLVDNLEEVNSLPDDFAVWINQLSGIQNDLNLAKNAGDALTGGTYSWQEFRVILDTVMNMDYMYINGTLFPEFDTSDAGSLLGGTVDLTLAPGSGIFADLAEFIGNFNTSFSYAGTNIRIATSTDVSAPYLTALAEIVRELDAADSTGEETAAVELTSTYGYALDLAFRCNASSSELLLQTAPQQRVYEGSASGSTLGGGSYMEFTSMDDSFSMEQRIKLMDAIRVAFLDDQNTVLGIAKLNTSNRSSNDGILNAPLYLYEYSISEEDGSMVMGERRKTENVITELEQNVAKAITVVVWLDGDIVDNSMVSATQANSLSGTLNLQFASSANLLPAQNGELMNYVADKAALDTLITENQETVDAGQLTYTNVSWNAFLTAYNHAVAVNDNIIAGELQIYNAAVGLSEAAAALEQVSQDALKDKVSLVRAKMGTVDGDIARYVIEDENGGYVAVGDREHTQQEHDSWNVKGTIFSVDYANNLHDEGGDVYTPVYTDASWQALAAALYQAEAVAMDKNATDNQLNAALTALTAAEASLQRQVFYSPYDYKGQLYYEAICDAQNEDTYGKWYDSEFKRVVSDSLILNLDAHAEPAQIVMIDQEAYIPWYQRGITPTIHILDNVYLELRNEEVKAIQWDVFDSAMFTEMMGQHHFDALDMLVRQVEENALDVDISNARAALDAYAWDVPAAWVENEIRILKPLVEAAMAEKLSQETALYITADQRTLLTAAINLAQSAQDYNETEGAALKAATETAQTVLHSGVYADEATQALEELNKQLDAKGMGRITAYNTLTHTVPVASEVYELVYEMEQPLVRLELTGKTGTTTLEAVVLTESGILYTATKQVTVYTPCTWVYAWDADTSEISNSIEMSLSDTRRISVGLGNAGYSDEEVALGNIVIEDGSYTVVVPENVKSYTWASGDTGVIAISGSDSETCILTPMAAGATYISVSVKTYEGNVYTTQIPVTVS